MARPEQPREPKQSWRAQCPHAWMSAIAIARQVCWAADSEQAQSRVAWARAVPRDAATSITRLSLGRAERSSHRFGHAHCSNSSAAAAKSGAPRVCAMPEQAAVERLNATAVQIMLGSQGDAGPPGRRHPVGEADLVPADGPLNENDAERR
jgi:hypothetical protein